LHSTLCGHSGVTSSSDIPSTTLTAAAASPWSSPTGASSATTYTQASTVSKKSSSIFISKQRQRYEAYLVIFFQELHAVGQPMLGPPPSHNFPDYLPDAFWDLMQQGSIAGNNQSPQLRQVFARNFRKHF
jgi:hypothetical protein